MSYREIMQIPFYFESREVDISKAFNHPLQPDSTARTFVIKRLAKLSSVRNFLIKYARLEEAYSPLVERRSRSLSLRNGDRVVWRGGRPVGHPLNDTLVLEVNYCGYASESLASASHNLPKPRLSLKSVRLNPNEIPREEARPEPVQTPNGLEYQVERILDYRQITSNWRIYCVLWVGYPYGDASWIGEEQAESLTVMDHWREGNNDGSAGSTASFPMEVVQKPVHQSDPSTPDIPRLPQYTSQNMDATPSPTSPVTTMKGFSAHCDREDICSPTVSAQFSPADCLGLEEALEVGRIHRPRHSSDILTRDPRLNSAEDIE
ncbi:hypothetical protein D9611_011027 [Ephemerocybe angulata]|uniref:Chromo domain-containing protein n=1 Tax=Ephemerocybe angulata TaxID=980116 RepID=A0A8H5F1M2_9AGAR|nr:hypothetical protein D9611_011027 [Tulosesus angulatus]